MRHDLARDACDLGEIIVVCQDAGLFTKSLEIQKFPKNANTVINIVRCDSNVGIYCECFKSLYEKDQSCEGQVSMKSKLLNGLYSR